MTKSESSRTYLWAAKHAIRPAGAVELVLLAETIADQGTKEANGEPYPGVNPADKDACSARWTLDRDDSIRRFEDLARSLGFAVNVDPGFYPVLIRNGTVIQLPD